ncbi:hypothetical protein [Streptomyces sp. SID13726]|uniref:hypothetical protein n=1 Tax=Streptomyces sp. SID13726 TaxID=2706058 RepID=UPI0013B887C4|nr:hypothetical protein [Streptomyces sp. SID13726]NEB01234.1 hypothetical protein [Streptomyces sp. SID13726]
MRMRAKVVTTIAAGLLAAAGMSAPTAAAVGQDTRAPASGQTVTNTWVYTWTSANIRSCASTQCSINYTVPANYELSAICWAHGQWVSQNGVSHDKWVLLGSGSSWIWGGLLKGNQTGNVPNQC